MNNKLPRLITLACLAYLAIATHASAADFQQGMRLKADNKLEAAAKEFEGVLAQNPRDGKALEQLAVIQGWLGRYNESIASWQRLLAIEPGREDARIGIARVQYWSQQPAAALQTLDDVLSRQPRSAEALTLKGDVLLARQQVPAAREAYQLALANGGDPAELQKKIARIVSPSQWRLDTGFGSDNFSNSRGTEYNGFVQLGYQVSPTLSVYGRYELARQFGSNDTTYFVGSYWQPAPDWLLFGEIGQTPSADFRPNNQVQVGLEYLGNRYLQPLLTYRHARYAGTTTATPGVVSGKGNVKTLTPGVRLIWPGAGNLELRVGSSDNIDGSTTRVSQLRLNLEAGDSWSPYIAYFNGKEALPPQSAASFKVVVLGAVYRLNDTWSLRADLANEQRRNFYTRNSLALGVGYRF